MVKKNRGNEEEMSFLAHIEVLRWHLVRSFLAILLFAIIAFIFRDFVFDTVILAPKRADFFTNAKFCELGHFVNVESLCINSKPFQIINIKMAGQFSTHIMVSLIVGFVVAFPYVFWEIWRFVMPALKNKEKRHTRGAVFFSSLLFTLGVLFGYYLITPLSVHFLGSYNVSSEVLNQINLNSYISTFTSVVLASGIIFELPIIIVFLSRAGLVTPEILKVYRRHSLVTILILSAIITPPDVFSQILVTFPLIILYEVGIYLSKKITKKREAELV
ncbi:MAG: twin-arginine translocase subunit TatC [Bacteroidales bacterium]|nr:twin-arginine translocase subunit TatC [Bacteroidales bacterium]